MNISAFYKNFIAFTDEELDTIDRMVDILCGIKSEMDKTDSDIFDVNGSTYAKYDVKKFLDLLQDMSSDFVVFEKDV